MNSMSNRPPTVYIGVGIENCWMIEPASKPRTDVRPLDVFEQMEHYRLWKEDLRRAAEAGVNAIRYSVPWYRSNPAPGKYDWDWIARPLDRLSQLGIVPIMDLLHYGAPMWLDNGVLNKTFPWRFAEYAGAFAERFAGQVDHYTPVNEPQTSAMFAGYQKRWPPYLCGVDGWAQVSLRLAEAMVLASRTLRSAARNVVLISADCFWSPGWDECSALAGTAVSDKDENTELLLSYLPASLAYGRIQPTSALARALAKLGYTNETFAWFATHAQPPDLFGFNYYPYGWDGSEAGCHQKRDDLVARCAAVYREFGRPIYITETSGGLTDDEKILWIEALTQAVNTLRRQGIAWRGINWWPLFDTIQWDYRENGRSVSECIVPGGWNNGLYRIEPSSGGELRRVPTRAVQAWREFSRSIQHDKTGTLHSYRCGWVGTTLVYCCAAAAEGTGAGRACCRRGCEPGTTRQGQGSTGTC